MRDIRLTDDVVKACSLCWCLHIDVSGQPVSPIYKGETVQSKLDCLDFEIGPLVSPETSLNNYQHMLHNIPGE